MRAGLLYLCPSLPLRSFDDVRIPKDRLPAERIFNDIPLSLYLPTVSIVVL
jgi:hypothetical protein